jgi:hypothetical protein
LFNSKSLSKKLSFIFGTYKSIPASVSCAFDGLFTSLTFFEKYFHNKLSPVSKY